MNRTPFLPSLLAVVLASAASAQILVTPNAGSDTLAAFSPVDGSLVNASLFPIPTATQVSAIEVNGEIWINQQTVDIIVRYDMVGNVLGTIGPTFPTGGMANIRGMTAIANLVYVTSADAGNGGIPDSIVVLDTAGNHVSTLSLSASGSPFAVIPWQGDILVTSFDANDDVHRYTMAGESVGTLHNSAALGAVHQISPANDGNVWVAGFTTGGITKLDAITGAVLFSFTASNARGVHELQNGNVMWTNSAGTWIYDLGTATSTNVLAGSSYHLNLVPYAEPDPAYNVPIGQGCHDFFDDQSNLFQLFANVQDAKVALDGNALQFTLTPNGYVATWLAGAAGALYVPPSGTATIVANVSTGSETIVTSAPIPIPGGTTPSWTLSSEGILTAGAVGNNASDTTPALADVDTPTGLAFYTWMSQNPTEAGSGKYKMEEAGGVLYVTAEGVECASGTPTAAPSTYQWQIDMTTGDVTMVWPSISVAVSASDVLVGVTLAGASSQPVSENLSAINGHVIDPTVLSMTPMSMTASPAPVISASTTVTYTVTNVPEIAPGSGLYLSLLFFSLNPLPGGLELQGILTTVPGCRLFIATLDVNMSQLTGSPVHTYQLTVASPTFSPGNTYAAQAIGFFDAAFVLPNGEAGGLLFSNGILSRAQ